MQERYRLVKNRAATDWWSCTFGDPFSWWILALIGDWKWITPNLITVFSFLTKVVPAGLFFWGNFWGVIAGVCLLQVSQILDSMDGNLARYRKVSSMLGGYLDRVFDTFGFLCVMSGLSWYTYTFYLHEPVILISGPIISGFYLIIAYMFWTRSYYELRYGKDEVIKHREKSRETFDVPLWKYVLKAQRKVVRFGQADFYFWIGFGIVIKKPQYALYILFLAIGKKLITRFLMHLKYMVYLDTKPAE